MSPEASSSAAAARPHEHSPELDGLRGVAIILVLLIHFQLVPKERAVEKLAFFVTGFGWAGVDLFFVLSGFLITRILLRARGRRGYYPSFMSRRALRIFPLYYLFLAMAPLLARALGVADWHSGAGGPIPVAAFLFYAQNYWLAFGGTWGPLNITWSLAIEEQFYVLWPLLVAKLNLVQLRRALVGIIVSAFVLRVALATVQRQVASYELTPTRIDALSVGALVGTFAPRFADVARFVRGARAAIVLGALGAGAATIIQGTPSQTGVPMATFGFSAIALAWGGVLVLVVGSPPSALLPRIARARWLRFFGKYSYSMYLFHYIVREALLRVMPACATPERVPRLLGTRWISQIGFYAIATLLTSLVAFATWHGFEKWFLRMRSHFTSERIDAPKTRVPE